MAVARHLKGRLAPDSLGVWQEEVSTAGPAPVELHSSGLPSSALPRNFSGAETNSDRATSSANGWVEKLGVTE